MATIKALFVKHKKFALYFLISCLVTVLDILISALGEIFVIPDLITNASVVPIISNAIGVISGFVVQYFLCSRKVYNKTNLRAFCFFFLTFIIGLLLAESIIFIFRTIVFQNKTLLYQIPVLNIELAISFLIPKLVSIVIPFFVMYFLRKKLIGQED